MVSCSSGIFQICSLAAWPSVLSCQANAPQVKSGSSERSLNIVASSCSDELHAPLPLSDELHAPLPLSDELHAPLPLSAPKSSATMSLAPVRWLTRVEQV